MPPKQERPTSHMSEFIDFGAGSTPRHKEDPHKILNSKGAPPIISSDKFKMLVKKYNDIKKLDMQDFNSVSEMTQFIDFYNSTILKAKQNEYEKKITDLNEYYWKLWIRAIEESR
jgi:hypothetical protein